ncbi:MAG: succinate dehydrogenase, partial [Rhodothermales bacterium]
MRLSTLLNSPIGKKLITGITGLGLTFFVLMHMVGNLSMFSGDDAYNEYAHFLASLGPLLNAVESCLVLFFQA